MADETETALERLLAVTEASYERRAQLEHALRSRVAIEQAKGIIAERHELDLDEAFELLRRASRTHRMKIHDLAARIRPDEPTPQEIEAVLNRAETFSPGVRVQSTVNESGSARRRKQRDLSQGQ